MLFLYIKKKSANEAEVLQGEVNFSPFQPEYQLLLR